MRMIWYHVSTPGVFYEIALPEDRNLWTDDDADRYEDLRDLADQYRTGISSTTYRIG